MRPVYMISGGITKFAKARADKDFRLMVKEAFDDALADLDGKFSTGDKSACERPCLLPDTGSLDQNQVKSRAAQQLQARPGRF
jgi:hypothetical protein